MQLTPKHVGHKERSASHNCKLLQPETTILETTDILKATVMCAKTWKKTDNPLQLRHKNNMQIFKSMQHQMTLLELSSLKPE